MSGRWLPEDGVRALQRYVLPGEERVVFVLRRHWITLVEPIATAVISGIILLGIGVALSAQYPQAAAVLGLFWLVLAVRAVYYAAEWQFSWFGTTQRRLMLTYGLITRKVAMMPLEKVTDMSYSRSPAGQLFGYGEFVLESAGQEQALRSVTFVPHPDETYRLLVSTMFGSRDARLAAPTEAADEEPDVDTIQVAPTDQQDASAAPPTRRGPAGPRVPREQWTRPSDPGSD